jgi:hypothetical protein
MPTHHRGKAPAAALGAPGTVSRVKASKGLSVADSEMSFEQIQAGFVVDSPA